MSKVKECAACGQGFTEENAEIGGRLTTKKCQDGHEGPFNRIATTAPPAGKYCFLMMYVVLRKNKLIL